MRYLVMLLALSPAVLESCSSRFTQQNPGTAESALIVPDYRDSNDWAAHPLKKDLADEVPAPLRSQYQPDSSVDVFYLHPTTLTEEKKPEWNGSLLDTLLNRKTDSRPILYQATAFNEYNVYAPRYRQAHLRSYFTSDTARARQAFDLAYSDVRAAFLEYLKTNQGRPIILAAHSQGSTHAIRLLKEFFDGKPLQKQLVAAYVIGMRIPDDFSSLKMCNDSTSTGCIVGWRSYKEGYTPEFVEKETGKAMVTNPLTWTSSDGQPAPDSLNDGAVLTRFDRVYRHAADARIHDRILWVSELHFPGSLLVRKKKNLHVGDINLYYVNIRENARTRVNAFHLQNGSVKNSQVPVNSF